MSIVHEQFNNKKNKTKHTYILIQCRLCLHTVQKIETNKLGVNSITKNILKRLKHFALEVINIKLVHTTRNWFKLLNIKLHYGFTVRVLLWRSSYKTPNNNVNIKSWSEVLVPSKTNWQPVRSPFTNPKNLFWVSKNLVSLLGWGRQAEVSGERNHK